MQNKPERLQKILSAHGIASRREAEKLILTGRVRVNGTPATLGQSALYGNDVITVDDIPLIDKNEHVYIMLNKPRGYITTVKDDRGRKTVMELVDDVGVKTYPAGRLDVDSEGLLIFTNDGDFANKITHPSNKKHKSYEVIVSGDVPVAIQLLRQPINIDDGRCVTAENAELIESKPDGGILLITVIEGRNRQIRKMCSSCGLRVKKLKRISIGSLMLGDLKPGRWRHLTKDEVRSLG